MYYGDAKFKYMRACILRAKSLDIFSSRGLLKLRTHAGEKKSSTPNLASPYNYLTPPKSTKSLKVCLTYYKLVETIIIYYANYIVLN